MKFHPEIASFIGVDEIASFDFENFFGTCPGCKTKLVHYDSTGLKDYKAFYCNAGWRKCALTASVKNFDATNKIYDYFCRMDLRIITDPQTYTVIDVIVDYASNTMTINNIDFPRINLDLRNVDASIQTIKLWSAFS